MALPQCRSMTHGSNTWLQQGSLCSNAMQSWSAAPELAISISPSPSGATACAPMLGSGCAEVAIGPTPSIWSSGLRPRLAPPRQSASANISRVSNSLFPTSSAASRSRCPSGNCCSASAAASISRPRSSSPPSLFCKGAGQAFGEWPQVFCDAKLTTEPHRTSLDREFQVPISAETSVPIDRRCRECAYGKSAPASARDPRLDYSDNPKTKQQGGNFESRSGVSIRRRLTLQAVNMRLPR